jgi:hypothetical protein
MFYVYAYSDLRTKSPFYIGKGKGNRWKSHLSLCHNAKEPSYHHHFYRKLRKMHKEDVKPQIVKVFEGGERACLQTEMTLIQSYGRVCDGGLLCNHTDGGEGTSGYHHSKTTRQKISEANKGQVISPETIQKSIDVNSHPVESLDRQTGEVKYTFKSMSEASRQGYSLSGICAVVNGRRKSHAGLFWRRAGCKDFKPYFVEERRTPIESFDLTTGETWQRFRSFGEAKEFGFRPGCIRNVISKSRHKLTKA